MASAWEADERPHQPCVVCVDPPDRLVTLPELPDVHVAFGSSAMCAACASLAASGDADGLTVRGLAGEEYDHDTVAVLVRLVLAWAGHAVPPAQLPPEPVRHREMPPLSDADRQLWTRLEALMFDGPAHAVTVRGRITDDSEGDTTVTLAWRDGPRARLTDGDGTPWLISDGVTTWHRYDERMLSEPANDDNWAGRGRELAGRRAREDVELFGFGEPIGPIGATTHLGRAAWSFRFAAPAHKPFDMQVVVDDETGFVLEKRFGDHSLARWTQFDTGEQVPAELFRWDGPTVSRDDLAEADDREHEQDLRHRAAWFAEHVTARPLIVDGGAVEVMLHVQGDDGRFELSLMGAVDGAVARRRRSQQWWPLGWSDLTAKWSDDTWDWAVAIRPDPRRPRPDDDAVAVRRWLTGP